MAALLSTVDVRFSKSYSTPWGTPWGSRWSFEPGHPANSNEMAESGSAPPPASMHLMMGGSSLGSPKQPGRAKPQGHRGERPTTRAAYLALLRYVRRWGIDSKNRLSARTFTLQASNYASHLGLPGANLLNADNTTFRQLAQAILITLRAPELGRIRAVRAIPAYLQGERRKIWAIYLATVRYVYDNVLGDNLLSRSELMRRVTEYALNLALEGADLLDPEDLIFSEIARDSLTVLQVRDKPGRKTDC